MSNHITVIDVEIGNHKAGFAIRVGKEYLADRLTGCIAYDTVKKSPSPNLPLYKYAGNMTPYTTWCSYDDAVKYAIALRNNNYPSFKVRSDCTIA